MRLERTLFCDALSNRRKKDLCICILLRIFLVLCGNSLPCVSILRNVCNSSSFVDIKTTDMYFSLVVSNITSDLLYFPYRGDSVHVRIPRLYRGTALYPHMECEACICPDGVNTNDSLYLKPFELCWTFDSLSIVKNLDRPFVLASNDVSANFRRYLLNFERSLIGLADSIAEPVTSNCL